MNFEEEKQKVIDNIHNDIVEEVFKKIPFKKIDNDLFMRVVSCSYNVLDEYVKRKDIYTYQVICNETNNTKESITKGELHCKVLVLFTVVDYTTKGWVEIENTLTFPHLKNEN